MKSTTIIIAVLLVASIIGGGYILKQNQSLDAVNKEMAVEIETLKGLRDDLIVEVDELHLAYDKMTTANDSLSVIFTATDALVKQQKSEIKKLKADAVDNSLKLTTEIETLRSMKKELTTKVAQLQDENNDLKIKNKQLVGLQLETDAKNEKLSYEITELKQVNLALQKELSNYVATSSRAANFRVDIRKDNDKPTGSYRRAREITISFDLKNIPTEKVGENRLFLVLNDAKGTPLKVDNPIITRVEGRNGKTMEIIAQQSQRLTLNNNVRVQFKQPVYKNLQAGYYRASVYTDWGVLGSAEFQLR